MRLVEFLLCPGTDLVQFRVQPSDLGVEFDKTQTLRGEQLFSLHASIVLAAADRGADASGRLPCARVALQIQQIQR